MKSYRANYIALLISMSLAMIGFGISTPVIPLFLEEDIGVRDPVKLNLWVGLIQSSVYVTLAIFAPIWGHLADRYSRRTMLLRAMFGGAFAISLMTFVNSPWQLLVLKCIQGCLTGTVAAATVLTASITPAAQLAFALGMLQTMIAVGNSLGPLVGGLISDFFSHRAAFFSTGLVLALAALIVLKWVDKDEIAYSEAKSKKLGLMPDMKPITGSPQLIMVMLVTLGLYAATNAATPMLPLFLKSLYVSETGAPSYIASASGIVLGVGAAFTALAAVLIGKVSSSIGYWRAMFLCFCFGAALTVPQIFVTNVLQLTIFRALSSFFTGGVIPVINAIIAVSTDKEHQGTVFGFNYAVASAGCAMGPILGSATAMFSYRAIFLVSAIILGLSALGTYKRWKQNSF